MFLSPGGELSSPQNLETLASRTSLFNMDKINFEEKKDKKSKRQISRTKLKEMEETKE